VPGPLCVLQLAPCPHNGHPGSRPARSASPARAGPFGHTLPLTADGTIFAVPTPGHMPGHMSLVVRAPDVTYFLAADATYSEALLKHRIADGPTANLKTSLDALEPGGRHLLQGASTQAAVCGGAGPPGVDSSGKDSWPR
jgi:glyoxylase-like metal-dependent hydrolase (beta-lactamase superfamily II)